GDHEFGAQDQGSPIHLDRQHGDGRLRPSSCASSKEGAGTEGTLRRELEVSSRWLSTRVPRQGLRPHSLRTSKPKVSADRRYLALALLGVSSPPPIPQPHSPETKSEATTATALLSVASSDATTSVFTLDLSGDRAWHHVASLEGHRHPVLCMAHVPGVHSTHTSAGLAGDDCDVNASGGPGGAHGCNRRSCTVSISGSGCGMGEPRNTWCRSTPDDGYWLATGDTAGDVALWWVPRWLHASTGACGRGTDDEAPGRRVAPEPRVLRPVLSIRGVHQSG
ncbi:hypothetical protein VaNZ11_001270, partial [Volvox africanus]